MADKWKITEKKFQITQSGEWIETERKSIPEEKVAKKSILEKILRFIPVVSLLIPLIIIAIQQRIQYTKENKSVLAELYKNISVDLRVLFNDLDTAETTGEALFRMDNYTTLLAIYGTNNMIQYYDTLLAITKMRSIALTEDFYASYYLMHFLEINNYLTGDATTTWIKKNVYDKNSKIIDGKIDKLIVEGNSVLVRILEINNLIEKYFPKDSIFMSVKSTIAQTANSLPKVTGALRGIRLLYFDVGPKRKLDTILVYKKDGSVFTKIIDKGMSPDSIFLFKDSIFLETQSLSQMNYLNVIQRSYSVIKERFDSTFLDYLRN